MRLALFGKATVLYAVGNICLRAASFLLIPIYAHFLSKDDYGLLVVLLMSVQFMMAAMNCGTEHCIVRFATHYEKNGQLSDLMGTTFFISIISALTVASVVLSLLLPFFQHVLHREEVTILITLTLFSALFQSLCDMLNAYYRSQHQPIKFTIVGVSTAVMLTIFSFVFIYFLKMGVSGALLAKIITYGWIFSIIAWQIYTKTGFRVSLKLVPRLLHFGFPLSMSSFGQYAITGACIFLLSFLSGLDSVAVFSLGQKLASVLLMLFVLPFQLSFQPFVFSQLNDPDIKQKMSRLLTYLMWSVVCGSFAILFGAKLFLPLIAPPEYADAYKVTLLIMPAMAFVGLFYFAETLLKAVQKSYIIGLFVIIAAVFSIIANFILVTHLSWYGTLIASNCTYFILGGGLFWIGLRAYPIAIEWRRLRIAVVMFLGILLINLILLKSNIYLYCIIQMSVICIVGFAVFRDTQIHESEKATLRNVICRITTLIKRPASIKPLSSLEREKSS